VDQVLQNVIFFAGLKDTIISVPASRALFDDLVANVNCTNSEFVEHSQSHLFPCQQEYVARVRKCLEARYYSDDNKLNTPSSAKAAKAEPVVPPAAPPGPATAQPKPKLKPNAPPVAAAAQPKPKANAPSVAATEQPKLKPKPTPKAEPEPCVNDNVATDQSDELEALESIYADGLEIERPAPSKAGDTACAFSVTLLSWLNTNDSQETEGLSAQDQRTLSNWANQV
jgi:hypothetical protein